MLPPEAGTAMANPLAFVPAIAACSGAGVDGKLALLVVVPTLYSTLLAKSVEVVSPTRKISEPRASAFAWSTPSPQVNAEKPIVLLVLEPVGSTICVRKAPGFGLVLPQLPKSLPEL